MILFLTSSPSGSLDDSHIVHGLDSMNRFIENLRRYWKSNARCLIITASPDSHASNDEMTAFFRWAVENAGLSASAFDLWDSRTTDFSKEALHSYDAVFLGGGHVPTQLRFFDKIGLKDSIRNFSGIIIGISAGSMDCAETVYAQPEIEGEALDPSYQRFPKGLGLTKTMLLPHYQMVKHLWLDGQRIYENITYQDSYGHRFLVLPDGSYLLHENGHETVWGEAYEIKNGRIRQICLTGQVAEWA